MITPPADKDGNQAVDRDRVRSVSSVPVLFRIVKNIWIE